MTLDTALIALEASGLIRPAPMTLELEYLFRHALIQDAAYASLLKTDRKVLHRAVAESLERLYPEQRPELASTLGQHYSAAGEAALARRYFRQAGDHALAQYANAESEQHYRAALDLTDSDADRAGLLERLGQALYQQSRYEEALRLWRETIDHYRSLGDSAQVAQLYASCARAAWDAGDNPRSLAIAREGLAVMVDQPESKSMAALLHEAARTFYFNSMPGDARLMCQQALDLAQRLGAVGVEADTLSTYGLVLDRLGDRPAALIAHEQAVRLAEAAGLLSIEARARNNLAHFIDDPHAALGQMNRAAELARQMRTPAAELFYQSFVARFAMSLGEFATAEAALRQMRQLLKEVVDPGPATFQYNLTEAYLLHCRGQWQEAAGRLRQVGAEVRQREDWINVLNADEYLVEVLVELGEWDEARNVAHEALDLEEGGLGDGAEPRWWLSIIDANFGQIEEARRLLAEAQGRAGAQPNTSVRIFLLTAQARLQVAEREWSQALAAYEALAAFLNTRGLRWSRAHSRIGWADVYVARGAPGDRDRARALWGEALSEFEAMHLPRFVALVRERLAALK